ncbi:MAG TPA: hypothetical protein DDW55_13930 [Gammaproteobacteria bacterium]|nr:hypothetical protein [Gammaproteobacteria bacterium]
MDHISNTEIGTKQKEMLVVMTALLYTEQNALLSASQLRDAKQSLQALFLRTSGEETMLRKLIDILKFNEEMHTAFSDLSKISTRIQSSTEIIARKVSYLRSYFDRLKVTPQESTDFFSPFMNFTHQFLLKVKTFNTYMGEFLEIKEMEARRASEYRIAKEASHRLKKRLSGTLGNEPTTELESSIKDEVIQTFDHAEAKNNLVMVQRESKLKQREIDELLEEINAMCQLAMNPTMREVKERNVLMKEEYEDVFSLFVGALKKHKRLVKIKDFLMDYFRLYQRAYGMFRLDFNSFNKAVIMIADNSQQYFEDKNEDVDIRDKRDKLMKLEAVINFLEVGARMITERTDLNYQRISKKLSELIDKRDSEWRSISQDLLVAKVSAEAEMSTTI